MSHITNEKWAVLKERMAMLGINEGEIKETFILASGAGGQKVNKTSSAVLLVYKDLQVRAKKSRNRDGNRYFARKQLCEIIADQLGFPTKDKIKIDKAIKQKKRRKRKAKVKYSD